MSTYDRDELREVSAAVLAVTAHLSVREVLQTIVSAARRLLDAEYAALGIPDGHGSFREFLADGLSDDQWRAIGPIPRHHGLLGAMLHDPNPVRSADIRTHPQFEGWPAAHPVMSDFLGMPIVDGDEILGEIFLANKRCLPRFGGFDERDEELLRLLAAHAAIAIVNARLYERSRELSIVEERQRIARELHDAVTQKLFSLRLTTDAAAALVARDPQRALAELETVRRLAADATAELKSIVVGLRPADLDGDGLAAALQRQAELLDRVHAARIRFTGDQLPKLSGERQEAAYRVAQEALHNALRHGDPRHVDIHLRRSGRGFVLRITDDGTGFDNGSGAGRAPGASRAAGAGSATVAGRSAGAGGAADASRAADTNRAASGGKAVGAGADAGAGAGMARSGNGGAAAGAGAQRRLGLASMRERARSVGGRLTVSSEPGAGTTVTMEVPGGC
ncbi:GAF domain-containing sensor histidine kinase [Dactylosporangium sp. NPDC049742]|uniref:GAF domain-containing sensor histidine kinase n=1 Tax=Dactylosporangium sp. NPDC049742 TaxID=3154737 RepID=UPI0034218B0A